MTRSPQRILDDLDSSVEALGQRMLAALSSGDFIAANAIEAEIQNVLAQAEAVWEMTKSRVH